MECACFDADVDDYSDVLTDKVRTARKEHRCHECRKTIKVGEKYRFEKTAFDGRIDTHKTCMDCISVREHLVCSFYWGEVWELVRESVEYSGDYQPWAKIGRLTPKARGRVCEMIEDVWGVFSD